MGPSDPRTTKYIGGDGNCFFCFISYIIPGSDLQHMDVRKVIVDHIKFIGYYPAGNTSAEQYIQVTSMDKFGNWGTETEMVTLANLLHILVQHRRSFQA